MEASTPQESKAQQVLHDADTYVRENPVPAVLCAIGIGFAVGLLVRALERKPTRSEMFHEKLHDAQGFLSGIFAPVAEKASRTYHRSSDAVRGVVEEAKEIHVEDYTAPFAKWFNRMWNKCCG